MDRQKILESGLLELYVMGSLDASEKLVVEQALERFPDLKSEVIQIEKALFFYANAHAIIPQPSLKENILSKVRKQAKSSQEIIPNGKSVSGNSYLWPFILSGLCALGMLLYVVFTQTKYEDLEATYERDKIVCDSISNSNAEKQLLLDGLASPDNQILQVQPTEKFPSTKLIIHHNSISQTNYLQLDDLPPLAADQSYQLWSLRDGEDPMPLNIFQGDDNIFKVSFIENTSAYAITIEKRGGSQIPDLSNLIGVIPVV